METKIDTKSLKITKDVHRELKRFCVNNELNMTVVSDNFIREGLQKSGHKFSKTNKNEKG